MQFRVGSHNGDQLADAKVHFEVQELRMETFADQSN